MADSPAARRRDCSLSIVFICDKDKDQCEDGDEDGGNNDDDDDEEDEDDCGGGGDVDGVGAYSGEDKCWAVETSTFIMSNLRDTLVLELLNSSSRYFATKAGSV